MKRRRLRDLGLDIGRLPAGPHNAITDVSGVRVGHTTLIRDQPRVIRTGLTVILPRGGTVWSQPVFAGYHAFNGAGEMTGMAWIQESGLLETPIGITNTNQVGLVRDSLIDHAANRLKEGAFVLPVVGETLDAWLNDINAFSLTREHVFAAIDNAADGPVAEGNVGGGTGMICHDFKGGIGTASRQVKNKQQTYTVGALVQANYGARHELRVDGVPVGQAIPDELVPVPRRRRASAGSIIVVIATDAPLLPIQCQRLAQRATVGLARVGGLGHNASGDLFLAFSTGNQIPVDGVQAFDVKMLPHDRLNPIFEAVAEAVEESILNALCMAETITGFQGRTVHALPLDTLLQILEQHHRL
jgi:D-aminopeptidase